MTKQTLDQYVEQVEKEYCKMWIENINIDELCQYHTSEVDKLKAIHKEFNEDSSVYDYIDTEQVSFYHGYQNDTKCLQFQVGEIETSMDSVPEHLKHEIAQEYYVSGDYWYYVVNCIEIKINQ